MKLLITLLIALSTLALQTSAGSTSSARSKVTTESIDGTTVQRTETIADPNPFPPPPRQLEEEKSRPLPNSNSINSVVKWVNSDAVAIAQDIAMSANGNNQFVGWNLNNTRVSFHNNLSNLPVWEFPSDPGTYRNFVSLSANSNIVAAGIYHHLYTFNKDNGTVTFDFPIPENRTAGPTAVSRDGTLLVCAASSPLSGGMHRVYAFHPPSTTPVWTFDFSDAQSTGIYGIAVSVDKSTVAVNGKFHGYILNANNGTVRTDFEIGNTEGRIALSADASVMAIAELNGFIKAFTWNASQNRYDLLWQYRIPAGTFTNWGSAVDVSADGLTIMAGSLIFLSAGYDGTIYMFDTFGEGTPNWIYTNVGDEVAAVALSDDGSIGAAITWGDLGNSLPDILVFERNSNVPVFTVNTPGSMFSLGISGDGKSIVAGGKAVHARQFGNGGNVYNIGVDLGGGAIAGLVTVPGPTTLDEVLVEVLGTNRTARISGSGGPYVVPNVLPGTYSVRISKRGYVATTITGVTVAGTDTTRNVNATLGLTGAAPTNLVASHGLSSRIQLTWTNPTQALDRVRERARAADPETDLSSLSVLHPPPSIHQPNHPPFSPTFLLADSIRMYRGIRSGGPYYLKRTLPGSVSSYVDSAAIPLKDYYYRITAIYGNGESFYSNEAYGTVDSSFLQFAITSPHRTVVPTVDGILSPGEWNDALKVDVSDVFGNGGGVPLPRGSTFMYFKYDSLAGKLYIAGEDFLNTDVLNDAEGFGLYFDDNNNNRFEPVGTEPLLREGNYWAYYFSAGSTVRFREIYTGGGVNSVIDTVTDAQTAFSMSSGHLTGEVSVPISFFDKNHLQVYGPDKKVGAGLFMINRSAGAAVFHGWWPQTMTSVFAPGDFGDIQIPIRLLAPPKAPSNMAVARQGNALRVTWTDPSEGINGDPLTIPFFLQLYRNGSLFATFNPGAQAFTDTNVVAEGWYEYKMRGFIGVGMARPETTVYYGPFSASVGEFAVSTPQLTEVIYDDGIPEVFYVVDFTFNDNKFGIRYTPLQYPTKVYRVKAFTNNGNSPILVSIHADNGGLPGAMLAGQYVGESHQTSGIDSFLVTIPGAEPPTITSGNFWVVLSYLPTSPGAPGIGGDYTAPIDGRSFYYTTGSGWMQLAPADLIVRAFITNQPVSVHEEADMPTEFALLQNYPNPFNPNTTIGFKIPASPAGGQVSGLISLTVYDVLGREVSTLVNEVKQPGEYVVNFDASNLASGVYLYKMMAGGFTSTKKMIVVK
jgi:hypothetical protein